MATRIIAIANQKGGVGKTTTAINLGHGLTLRGYNVLLVDLDAQGSSATYLGVSFTKTLYHVLVQGEDPATCVVPVRRYPDDPQRGRFDLLPSDWRTAQAKDQLVAQAFGEMALKQALGKMVRSYDYVLLDCAPSLDILNVAALLLCNEVLIPVAVNYLDLVGVGQYLETVREVREHTGQDIRLLIVLPTFYDSRPIKCREILGMLQRHFGKLVADPIRANVRVAEAPSHQKTIFEYDPRSYGAIDYAKLVERVDGK